MPTWIGTRTAWRWWRDHGTRAYTCDQGDNTTNRMWRIKRATMLQDGRESGSFWDRHILSPFYLLISRTGCFQISDCTWQRKAMEQRPEHACIIGMQYMMYCIPGHSKVSWVRSVCGTDTHICTHTHIHTSAHACARVIYLDNVDEVWRGCTRLKHVEECHKYHWDRHLWNHQREWRVMSFPKQVLNTCPGVHQPPIWAAHLF